jgi:hypothetical protein
MVRSMQLHHGASTRGQLVYIALVNDLLPDIDTPAPRERLTPFEHTCAIAMANGLRAKQIADLYGRERLDMTPAFRKLNVFTAPQFITACFHQGYYDDGITLDGLAFDNGRTQQLPHEGNLLSFP